MDDIPITAVEIISSPNSANEYNTIISKTHDSHDDADLYKDGFFSRVNRYLTFSRRQTDSNGKPHDVLTDMGIIPDRDAVPPGFQAITFTSDSREKALKRVQLIVRFSPRSSVLSAITDIIILSTSKKPPPTYTGVGEANNLYICYKLSRLRPSTTAETSSSASGGGGGFMSIAGPATVERPATSYLVNRGSSMSSIHPLSGVVFAINKKYLSAANNCMLNSSIEKRIKSKETIDLEFQIDFKVENTVLSQ